MMMMKRIIKCIVRITAQALPTPSQHFPFAVPCSLAIARIDLTDWCHKHDWAWPVDVKLMSGSQLRWNTKKEHDEDEALVRSDAARVIKSYAEEWRAE